MCAIVDTNSISEVGGREKSVAGADLYKWIMRGGIQLVAGKSLLDELNNKSLKDWYDTAISIGKVIRISRQEDDIVAKICEQLIQQNNCKSDDEHIIALAQVSGARLLYTQDEDLKSDFKDLKHGKIYPRGKTPKAKKARDTIHKGKKWCVAKSP